MSSSQSNQYKTELDDLSQTEERNLHRLFQMKRNQIKNVARYAVPSVITAALALGVLVASRGATNPTSYRSKAASLEPVEILVPQSDHTYPSAELVPKIKVEDPTAVNKLVLLHNNDYVCERKLPPYNCTLYLKEGANTLLIQALDSKDRIFHTTTTTFYHQSDY